MNDKQKSNKYIEAIKKLSKSSRGKAILFFIFYFIFFFVLIAFLRSSYNNYEPPTTNTTIHSDYKISGITNGNYHFIREELINNNLTTFTGDKADNKVFSFGILARSTESDDICTECIERFLGNSSRVDRKG